MNEKEFKGLLGESLIEKIIEKNIKIYHKILRNIQIKSINGNQTEIDLILLTYAGIFVIESKNHKGLILENNKEFTQFLHNSRIILKPNPVKQNEYHIKSLAKHLNIEENKFFNYIVFGYDVNLKTENPNVINIYELENKLINDIINSNSRISHEEIDDIYMNLQYITNNINKTQSTCLSS